MKRHATRCDAYAPLVAVEDNPDDWWASLSDKRKAAIHRWVGPKDSAMTPEEMGMEPLIDEDSTIRAEAAP